MAERVFRKGNLQMHARLQGGSMFVHDVLDGDKIVGSVSVTTIRKKGVATTTRTFAIGTETFDSLEAFRSAYEKKLTEKTDG